MTLLKAIGYCALGLIILLGAFVLLGIGLVAWPILIGLLIFGLPFTIVGIVVEKKKKDK